MKNSIDTIGNGTPNLPACGAVSQPTAPPRAPSTYLLYIFFSPEERSKLYSTNISRLFLYSLLAGELRFLDMLLWSDYSFNKQV